MNLVEALHSNIVDDLHGVPCYPVFIEQDSQAIVYHKQLVSTFHESTERVLVPLYNPRPGMAGYVQEVFNFAQEEFGTGSITLITVREEGKYYGYFGCALVFKQKAEKDSVKASDLASIKGKLFRKK